MPIVFESALTDHLLHLDLNLLVALDALLSEKSVTRAAARSHRSQAALSGSLKRLRQHFRDDLLVRVGNNLELTPLGSELHERLPPVISDIIGVFAVGADFDPATSSREFVVLASDYAITVFGPHLTAAMDLHGHSTRLRFEPLFPGGMDDLSEPMRGIDGLIAPEGTVDGWPSTTLYRDEWVLVIDAAHPRRDEFAAGTLSVDDLSEMDWALPYQKEGSGTVASQHLRFVGVRLNSVVSVAGFTLTPAFVRGTERITVMQRRLTKMLGFGDELAVFDFPGSTLPVVQALWWHPIADQDQGHRWFRELCRRAGLDLADP